tara:strand:- start:12605 stop:13696 length:1092 start_codon:yes stop_codon:yes gene_type:complete
MERLNWHMADELSRQTSVRVIGPKGAAVLKPKGIALTEVPLKPVSLFLLTSFLQGVWLGLCWKPDVILAGSGLTAPIAWLLSKLFRARSAVYLHGFDITVNHVLYRRIWRPTFKKLDKIIVNSAPTQALAVEAGVCQTQISIIYPGVSIPAAPQPEEKITEFKKQHDLTDNKILLSVGRLTTRKGLREFVQHALPNIVKVEPTATLLVIGESPKQSLGASIQTMESIKAQAEKSGVSGNIKFLGVITDRDHLATAYEAADVHVFPVRCIADDPEGFGMVAIEAAAHGVPSVAFATGGVVDAISSGKSGLLVEPGNYSALTQNVLAALASPESWKIETKAFARSFGWQSFGEQIMNVLATHKKL